MRPITAALLSLLAALGCSEAPPTADAEPPPVGETASRLTLQQLAGDYAAGIVTEGESLRVGADGRFAYCRAGALGVYAENEGGTRLAGGYLVLTPEKPNGKGTFPVPTEFLAVVWGPRTYLVAKDRLLDLCNDINQGLEPRRLATGTAFLRHGDWQKDVRGVPRLPAPWPEYLLAKPLRGEVTGRAGEGRWRVNLGARDGVREGMVLTARGKGPLFCQVRVASVQQDVCVVRPEYDDRDGLARGDRVTSRLHDRD
jgi:hypothetical protein